MMTEGEFASLAEGTCVWFSPPYFAFPMPAVVRIQDGRRGLWVNFFGDGQCLFAPQDGAPGRFASWVRLFCLQGNICVPGNPDAQNTKNEVNK